MKHYSYLGKTTEQTQHVFMNMGMMANAYLEEEDIYVYFLQLS